MTEEDKKEFEQLLMTCMQVHVMDTVNLKPAKYDREFEESANKAFKKFADKLHDWIEAYAKQEVEKQTKDFIGFVNSLPDCGDVCSTQEGCFGCLFKDSFMRFFRDNKYFSDIEKLDVQKAALQCDCGVTDKNYGKHHDASCAVFAPF